jgi:hypothetical protein
LIHPDYNPPPINGKLTLSRGAVIAPLVVQCDDKGDIQFAEAVVTEIEFDELKPNRDETAMPERFNYLRPAFQEVNMTVKLKIMVPITW